MSERTCEPQKWCEQCYLMCDVHTYNACRGGDEYHAHLLRTAEDRKHKTPELGTQVAKMLDSIGVTKKRWAELVQVLGYPPADTGCGGCATREKWLNSVSAYVRQSVTRRG